MRKDSMGFYYLYFGD